MNDIERLGSAGASRLERELLTAARDYQLPPGTRERTLDALGLSGPLELGSATVSAGSKFGTLGKALFVAAAVGTLSAAGVFVAHTLAARSKPPSETAANTPSETPSEGRATGAMATSKVPSVSQPSTARAPEHSSGRGSAARAPAGDTLAAEVKALEAARQALHDGGPARALDLLSQHARTFPKGRLRLEARALRIESLAANGKQGQAAREAREFLRRHPKSPLAARLRRFAEP